mmetsp:Transcript_44025/g.84115  ORF Transcript_44025/g.84115 Transcript_44025/m.84115 type:complete len:241 (+) Transcript_44025:202-924(+)
MTQVQHVLAILCLSLRNGVLHSCLNGSVVRKQHHWVHISLESDVISQPGAAVRHVDAPVQADAVHARGCHTLQQAPAAVGVQRERRVRVGLLHSLDHLHDVRLGEDLPVGRSELPTPRVKDLHALRSGVNLEPDVLRELVGEVREDGLEGVRVLVHHGLDGLVDARALALHHVRGQRPGRAHEAQHRRRAAHLPAQRRQRLPHKVQLVQLDGAQRGEPFLASDGVVQKGPLDVVNLKVHP